MKYRSSYNKALANRLCEFALRIEIAKTEKESEDGKGYNQCPNQGLKGEPDAGFLDNTLQIISELGKEFLLLQFVFLEVQFLIGNEPAMKVIDRQGGLVAKLDHVLRFIPCSVRCLPSETSLAELKSKN